MAMIDTASPYAQSSVRKGRDPARFSMRGRVIGGVFFAIVLLGGIGGWAATARLSGAVIGQGAVHVDEDLKVVQHPDGGVVREIAVRVGDRVTAGQVLLRLDETQVRAEHAILEGQLMELEARRLRLLAERDGLTSIGIPESFFAHYPQGQKEIDEEAQLFASNLEYRNAQNEQIHSQIGQLEQEIIGLEAQQAANLHELELTTADRSRLRTLASDKLVETSRVTSVERDTVRLEGQIGEVKAAIARAGASIGELKFRVMGMDSDRRTVAQRELRAVDTQLAELRERHAASGARVERVIIRAPVSGIVNDLSVSTLGGVISPAERLITIVPDDADLRIQFRVAITDIDQVTVGKDATLRFSAFNQRVTPEAQGVVSRVAAAAQFDQASGQSFYDAEVEITGGVDGGAQLVPGMPVEVFIQTEEQLALAYFMKPFTDQVARSFREE